MTADKANELVDLLNSDATPEARLAAWLWIEDAIHEAVAEQQEIIRKELEAQFRKG